MALRVNKVLFKVTETSKILINITIKGDSFDLCNGHS